MRKIVAILIISLLSFVFILPKQASAQNNIRTFYEELYEDAVNHNNVLALLELEVYLVRDPSKYKSLNTDEDKFAKTKAQICKNYFASADALTLSLAEKNILESACNTPFNLSGKF